MADQLAAPRRTAHIHWARARGAPPRLTVGSESIAAAAVSLDPDAPTPLHAAPGELLAGGIGSVLVWLVADELAARRAPARELNIEVTLEVSSGLGGDALLYDSINCRVQAFFQGAGDEPLAEAARRAADRCRRGLGLSDAPPFTLEVVTD